MVVAVKTARYDEERDVDLSGAFQGGVGQPPTRVQGTHNDTARLRATLKCASVPVACTIPNATAKHKTQK